MRHTTLIIPRKNSLLLILFLFFLQNHCFAQKTTRSTQDGLWDLIGTWDNGVPVNGDTVIIRNLIDLQMSIGGILGNIIVQNGGNLRIPLSANSSINTLSLNIETGGTLEMNNGNINITQSLTQEGGGIFLAGGNLFIQTGDLNINGNVTTDNANINLPNGTLIINENGNVNINDNTGSYIFSNGITINPAGSFQVNGDAIFSFSGTIINQGIFNKTGIGAVTFSNVSAINPSNPIAMGGDVTITSGNLTINSGQGITFQNTLDIGVTTVTNNGNVSINQDLNGSGVWTNAANSQLNYGGVQAPMRNGTLTASSNPNTVTYNGLGNQAVNPTSYFTLSHSGGGTKTLTGNLTIERDLNTDSGTTFEVTGSSTFNGLHNLGGAGNIILNIVSVPGSVTNSSTNLSINGDLDGTGIWRNGDNSRLNYAGTGEPMASGDLFVDNNGNTFHYSSTGQTIKATTYFNLELSGNTSASPGSIIEINGSWTNNGDFTPGTSTVVFNAIDGAAKTISNNESFNNLTLTNNTILNTPNGASIDGILDLQGNSRLISDDQTILLNADASVSNTSTGFVDGWLRKNGLFGNFRFPLGDGNISGRTDINGTGDFAVRYFSNPNTPTPNVDAENSELVFISNFEYWQIERFNGAVQNNLTLFWEDNVQSGITAPSDLRIAKWDQDNAIWLNQEGTVDTNNNSIGADVNINDLELFTLGSLLGNNAIGNPPTLPTAAELNSVIPNDNNDVELRWTSPALRHTSEYDIQRAEGNDNDGNFVSLPQGQNIDRNSTSFIDGTATPGRMYFYRVLAKNGTATAPSNVLGLIISGLEGSPLGKVTKVFPNPSQGPTQVEINNLQRAQMNWEVVDLQGRVVQSGTSDEVTSDHSYLLDFTNLSSGTYLLKVSLGDLKTVKKFVKD